MTSARRGGGLWRWAVGAFALAVAFAVGSPAQAAPQYQLGCSDCHTMPPKDSENFKKNPFTGAVPGKHQTHAGSAAASCAVCHGDAVLGYATGHRNKTIELSDGLGYSRKAAGFLNQTSVPPNPLGSCSTAVCHSNGKGVLRTTPDWANPAPATCDTCHDSAPSTASHTKHISTYSMGCAMCHTDHQVEAKPFQHASSAGKRSIDVHFTTLPNSGGSFAAGQCSSTYCHSNGQGGAPNVAATWGGTVNCSGCHGTANSTGAAALSGKHAQHVNNAAYLGTSYGCKECHVNTVSGSSNYAITDRTLHVNGTKDLAGAKLGTVNGGSCSTSYCHSNGKGVQLAVSWNQTATLGCNGCHGTGNSTGAPDYANGGAGAADANSHGKHALASGDCVNCHSNTTTNGTSLVAGGQHINGFINFSAGNGKSFTKGANKTCSNISCHSGNGIVQNVATAQWGATLNCQGCHTTLSAGHTAHTTAYGCETCHADTVVDRTTLKAGGAHMNNAINVAGQKITNFDLANQTCAASCHTGAVVPKWNDASTGACGTCHNVTSPLIATGSHGAHFSALNGPQLSQDLNGCQVCHLYSGEKTHVDGVKNLNLGFAANGACSTCHKQSSTQWGNAASVTCQSCHTGSGSTVLGKVAPVKDLAATSGHGAFGKDCVACHSSSSAHIGATGSRLIAATSNATCDSCHLVAGQVTDASLNMRVHQASGLGSQCADCHDPHGTANSKMVSGTINGTGVSYTGTTTFANEARTGVCQVCHVGGANGTKYFTAAGEPVQQHVDSTANCLECHKHNPSTGLAFVPNGTCDACHGYPPAPRKLLAGRTLSFGVQGSWSSARFEDYSGGGGAHLLVAHIRKDVRPSDGWEPCLPCHSGGAGAHARVLPIRNHVENVTVSVDQALRFAGDYFASYSSANLSSGGANKTGSCFNVSCHFQQSKSWSIER